MMSKSYLKLLAVILLGLSAFIIFTSLAESRREKPAVPEQPVGGVTRGNEHMSTSTPFFGAGAGPTVVREKTALVQQVIATTTPDSLVPPMLGSVVIASTTGHTLRIWDATSTDAINDAAGNGNPSYLFNGNVKLLATFATSTTVGTWTFDVATKNGLIVECEKDFNGDYIITYR